MREPRAYFWGTPWNERLMRTQYGGSPIKVGEDEYSIFRDHEYVRHIITGLADTNEPAGFWRRSRSRRRLWRPFLYNNIFGVGSSAHWNWHLQHIERFVFALSLYLC
jgi:hypothetical protein